MPAPAPRPLISATILTYNEEANLPRCLSSLDFVDEIVVVDSGSTDRTPAIATDRAHRVLQRPWQGFRRQRETAFQACTGTWILFVDADEWFPPWTGREIREAVARAPDHVGGFRLSRRNWFLDRWMDHAWSPDHSLRVFRRGLETVEGHEPHIHVRLPASVKVRTLEHPFCHRAYDTLEQMLQKTDRYSTLFAAADETDARFSHVRFVLSPLVSLFKSYVIKRGFLDGVHGHVVAWNAALYHFLKYAKKWQKLRGARAAARAVPGLASPGRRDELAAGSGG